MASEQEKSDLITLGYEEIDKRLKARKLVILDGATGTEICRRGVATRGIPWSLSGLIYEPDTLRRIHYDYFVSGANVVTADCFYTTSRALKTIESPSLETGAMAKALTYLAVYIAKDAQALARKSGIRHATCVAGNVAPLEVEDPYDATKVVEKGVAVREHREKIQHLIEADVDLILIETMTTLYEAEAALEGANLAGPKIPIWVSFSLGPDGSPWSNIEGIPLERRDTVEQFVRLVESYATKIPIRALLLNCTRPEAVTKGLEEILRVKPASFLPLGAYANVEEQVYGSGPWDRRRAFASGDYAKCCKEWIDLGVQIVGGCCGTTPADIKAVVQAFKDIL